jgi:ABC-type branched-subunit amino acid transport system permease subunit
MVGGLGTLVGPIIGCVLMQMLVTWAGTLPQINPNFILGLVLIAVVPALPMGLLPTVTALVRRL